MGFPPIFKFIENDTLAVLFSGEFWEIFEKIFFVEHLQSTASV